MAQGRANGDFLVFHLYVAIWRIKVEESFLREDSERANKNQAQLADD